MKQLTQLIVLLITTLQLSAQLAVTIPGEFEKKESLILTWSNQQELNLVTTRIISNVQHQIDTVWVLYQTAPVTIDTAAIHQFLLSNGATMVHVQFLEVQYQSPWIGNYGPITGFAAFENDLERFIFNPGYAWNESPEDDSIPARLADIWNWPVADMGLQLNAGNLLHDAIKRGFSTKKVLGMNPQLTEAEIKARLIEKYNLSDWVFLDTLAHSGGGPNKNLDMMMKVLDFETLLVSEYPDTLPDYQVVEQNVSILQSLTDAFGVHYTIFRIPAPPRADGTFGASPEDEMRTYTNSLILNHQIIIPSFGLPWYDSVATAVYQEAMPGYQIISVDASAISPLNQGIHNLTNSLPQGHYLRIEHRKIIGQQAFQADFQITCMSKAGDLVEEMWLYYKLNADTVYQKTPVYLVCPEHFGVIHGLSETDTVHYYLESISSATTTRYPLSAPSGNFTFWFDVISGVEAPDDVNSFAVYPNPGNGEFEVTFPDDISHAKLLLYHLNGKIILEKSVKNHQKIDVRSELSPGIYLLRLKSSDQDETIKLLIR
ncbi:MAG: agmatine deiminase family protein [Bacteroidales bacterium]|nr:agmatine deiminase family protein [Bacteroidales bacterium]